MTHAHPPHPRPAIRRALPRAAPVVLNLGDQVTIGGVLFTIGAALIPVNGQPAPPPVPAPTPPPNPLPGPQPTIKEFRDATRSFAISGSTLTGGQAFSIEGSGFGTVPGKIIVQGSFLLPITGWADDHILTQAPPYVAGAAPAMWTIYRADATSAGGYYSFKGPTILPGPALEREEKADHAP